MSLIIQSGARQYMVEPGQTIIVTQIEGEVGSVLPLALVHATGEHLSIKEVFGQIIGHQRGEKVIVAKYKPKSNYRRRYGPRQEETLLLITTSETSVEPKKTSVKKKAKAV